MDIASSTQFVASIAGYTGIGIFAILGVTVSFGFAVYLINWGIKNLRYSAIGKFTTTSEGSTFTGRNASGKFVKNQKVPF